MGFDPHEFWLANEHDHPPLTDEMVAFAERELGVRLPAEYLALLRIQNGGDTQGFAHPMGQWPGGSILVYELAGIVTDPGHRTTQNILVSADMTEKWDLPTRQVLLSGEGRWWITIDYRHGDSPTVAWLCRDRNEDLQVAPSFVEFLEDLRPI